jgi:tetratricopeptide (TPR) repeat protein
MGVVTIVQHQHVLAGASVRTGGAASRLVAAGWIPWFYLSKVLLPVNLTMIYPKVELDASRWVSWVPGMALAGCFALFWGKRKTWGRPPLFGFGYFVVMFFPVLGFFDQSFYRYSLVSDHWQYYSIIGPIALVVAAGERICRQMGERGRYWLASVGVAVLVALGAASWRRCGVYVSDETLWRNNVAANPAAWLAHSNLGVALSQQGRGPEAIAEFEEALRVKPDYAEAHVNLGVILAQQGETEEAIKHYERALRIKPDYEGAHMNLGLALLGSGRASEAITEWEEALRINPNNAAAHNNLGLALAQTGKPQEAISHFEQALRIEPGFAEARYDMGLALAGLGRLEEAVEQWQWALRIRPDYAQAHYNLGLALARTGKLPEAIEHWDQALRLKPDYPEAHYNLGIALERTGHVQEAIMHFERALQEKPDFEQAQNALRRLQAGQR